MRRLGALWTYRGRYASLEDEIAEIERLEIGDLKRLAREFPLRPVLRAMVLPESA